jgi:hypothetical protein
MVLHHRTPSHPPGHLDQRVRTHRGDQKIHCPVGPKPPMTSSAKPTIKQRQTRSTRPLGGGSAGSLIVAPRMSLAHLNRRRLPTVAPCCFGPIALDGGTTCSERIVDIDQSGVRDDLVQEWPCSASYVAALDVSSSRHRKGAAVVDDLTRVSVNCARARSAQRPIQETRPCATEVPWQ